MFELVPSNYMRKYFKEIGFEFSDFEKATLIWEAEGKTWKERLDALRELAETTEDPITRKQVLERIAFEEKAFAVLKSNPSENYVYVVEDSEDRYSCGFFADYQLAEKYVQTYSKEYEHRCAIEKQQIIKTLEESNRYEGSREVGSTYFNKNGEMTYVWSLELKEEEIELLDETKGERFEDRFIKMPFPLETGSAVNVIGRDICGVLSYGKENWDAFLQRVEERAWEPDFSDVQVVVYDLMEDGCWSHSHINPIYLEPVELPPDIQNDRKNNAFWHAMEKMGEYLRGREKEDYSCQETALKATREYVKICYELKDSWEKTVEEAKTPEDIMM